MRNGLAGTPNLSDPAVRLPALDAPGLVMTVPMLFLAAFGIPHAAGELLGPTAYIEAVLGPGASPATATATP